MTKPCKICGDPIDALIIRKRTVHCLSCSSKLTGTVNRKHGGSETREYARWTSMRRRGEMSTPYRPSNGTEGEGFYENWCAHCARDAAFREDPDSGDGCPIVAATFVFDVTHPEYPKEWIEDEKGPRCTAFTTDPTKPARCDQTVDMFAMSPAHRESGDQRS